RPARLGGAAALRLLRVDGRGVPRAKVHRCPVAVDLDHPTVDGLVPAADPAGDGDRRQGPAPAVGRPTRAWAALSGGRSHPGGLLVHRRPGGRAVCEGVKGPPWAMVRRARLITPEPLWGGSEGEIPPGSLPPGALA